MNESLAKSALEHEKDRRLAITSAVEKELESKTLIARDISTASLLILAAMITVATTRIDLIKTTPLFVTAGTLYTLCIVFIFYSRIQISRALSRLTRGTSDRYIDVASSTRLYLVAPTEDNGRDLITEIEKPYPKFKSTWVITYFYIVAGVVFAIASAMAGASLLLRTAI